jgi:hypothetical protein
MSYVLCLMSYVLCLIAPVNVHNSIGELRFSRPFLTYFDIQNVIWKFRKLSRRGRSRASVKRIDWSAVYRLQAITHSTEYSVGCYGVRCTVYTVIPIVADIPMISVHCNANRSANIDLVAVTDINRINSETTSQIYYIHILHTIYYILHTIYILYTTYYIQHSIYYILYTIYYILYTV